MSICWMKPCKWIKWSDFNQSCRKDSNDCNRGTLSCNGRNHQQYMRTNHQTISSSGVWNMMQRLGERIDEEEQYAVKEMHADRAQGEKVIPVLFEEMDGIWLHMQNSNHKKMKKQEMKVFSMYEGWDKEQKKRSSLVEKTMFAGMESSQIFHEKREALIEKKYNADEIQQRILFVSSNPCNPFSLPVFHEKKI